MLHPFSACGVLPTVYKLHRCCAAAVSFWNFLHYRLTQEPETSNTFAPESRQLLFLIETRIVTSVAIGSAWWRDIAGFPLFLFAFSQSDAKVTNLSLVGSLSTVLLSPAIKCSRLSLTSLNYKTAWCLSDKVWIDPLHFLTSRNTVVRREPTLSSWAQSPQLVLTSLVYLVWPRSGPNRAALGTTVITI